VPQESSRRPGIVCRIVSAAIALLAMVAAGITKDVKIGLISVNLTAPSGHCELDDRKADDTRLLQGLRDLFAGRNQLLAAYADCHNLTDFWSGKQPTLNDYATYTTPVGTENSIVPVEAIKQVCTKLRTEGEQRLAKIMSDRASSIEEVFKGIKVNETRHIGVVAEDPTVCYYAQLQKLITEAGSEKTQIGISAAMVTRGKFIVYHLYSPYVGGDTATALLAKHKTNVAAFFAANKN
jgi:hypothetical protein